MLTLISPIEITLFKDHINSKRIFKLHEIFENSFVFVAEKLTEVKFGHFRAQKMNHALSEDNLPIFLSA